MGLCTGLSSVNSHGSEACQPNNSPARIRIDRSLLQTYYHLWTLKMLVGMNVRVAQCKVETNDCQYRECDKKPSLFRCWETCFNKFTSWLSRLDCHFCRGNGVIFHKTALVGVPFGL